MAPPQIVERRTSAPDPREAARPGRSLLELRASFRAMGTVVGLVVRCAPQEREAAREALAAEARWFRDVERALSRFDPDSELSRLNRLAEHWCVVSPLLYSALNAAARAYRLTEGLFDPSILPALERWGYDRDFREIAGCATPRRAAPGGPAAPLPPTGPPATVLRTAPARRPPFALDPVAQAVRLEEGIRIDLGGIVKGLAADTALRRLAARFPAALVDAGGDVAAAAREGTAAWRVALPMRGAGLPGALRVRRGGVATSATARRWVGPLGASHHLIDPRTQAPADSGLEMVTVVTRSAAAAEVLAKALLVGGAAFGPRLLARARPAQAFWRTSGGEVGTYRCPCG